MGRPTDVSAFARRQARDEEPSLKVSTDQVSAVGKARAAGQQSAGRAGQFARTSGQPTITFETINDIDWIVDIDPRAFGKRMLALETDDDQSQGMSVTTGYQVRDAEEHGTPDQISGSDNFGPYDRQHVLLIQFGTANAPSAVEVDIVEGMSINIPGAKCEVTLLDYTFTREENPASLNDVRSHASAANGAVSTRAQMTQMVFAPFQWPLDLANPPTFAEMKAQLIEAVTLGHIISVGTP